MLVLFFLFFFFLLHNFNHLLDCWMSSCLDVKYNALFRNKGLAGVYPSTNHTEQMYVKVGMRTLLTLLRSFNWLGSGSYLSLAAYKCKVRVAKHSCQYYPMPCRQDVALRIWKPADCCRYNNILITASLIIIKKKRKNR